MMVSGRFYDLHRKTSACQITEIDWFQLTSEFFRILVYQIFNCWAAISTVTTCVGRRKMSHELIRWLLPCLKAIRHRKIALLPIFHVVSDISID